jgi:hypothetical protein
MHRASQQDEKEWQPSCIKKANRNISTRRILMKIKQTLMTLGLTALVAGVVSLGYSQAPTPGQAPGAGRGAPGATAPAAEKTFEGKLGKVDAATKTILVSGVNEKDKTPNDMSFKYDDATVVVGGDKTIQGLAGKAGSQLKITYHTDQGNNIASKIELAEK